MPQRAVCATRIRRFVALSSTISTVLPLEIGLDAQGRGWESRRRRRRPASGRRDGRRFPRPATPVLSAVSEPSISSASRRLIARPRPVPPYRRAIEASTWLNDWNSLPMASARDADPGVADVDPNLPARPRSRRPRRSTCDAADRHDDLARCVNFTAFESRLSIIWRSRPCVADQRDRQVVVDRVDELQSLRSRPRERGCRARPRPPRAGRRARASRSTRPASIFEKSRTSLMIVSSASPDVRIVSANSRCSPSSGGVEQQAAHADDRVERRPDLVAHRREEAALRLVRLLGGRPRLLAPRRTAARSRCAMAACCARPARKLRSAAVKSSWFSARQTAMSPTTGRGRSSGAAISRSSSSSSSVPGIVMRARIRGRVVDDLRMRRCSARPPRMPLPRSTTIGTDLLGDLAQRDDRAR